MKNLTAENQLLLSLSNLRITELLHCSIKKLIPRITNWDSFFQSAVNLGVGSIISKTIENHGLQDAFPKKIVANFNQTYFKSLNRNVQLYEFFGKLITVLISNKIDFIPLKGIFIAQYFYNDIGLRQMSDIDILVKKEDGSKCLKILSEMGFKPSGKQKNSYLQKYGISKHLPTMILNDLAVEIHYQILIDNSYNSVDIREFWENSERVKFGNTTISSLSAEHLLQYLCLHLERHLNEGKFQLYQFIDLVILLDHYKNEFKWNNFENSCLRNKSIKNTSRILYLLQKYFSISFPENIKKHIHTYHDPGIDNVFISIISCNTSLVLQITENQNLRSLKKIKGFKNKAYYLLCDIFPAREFMLQRYHFKNKYLIVFFYAFRFFTGIVKLMKHFWRKLMGWQG